MLANSQTEMLSASQQLLKLTVSMSNKNCTYTKSVFSVCEPLAIALNSTPSRSMSSGNRHSITLPVIISAYQSTLHYHQRRTDKWSQLACTEKFSKVSTDFWFLRCEQTDIDNRHVTHRASQPCRLR